MIQFSRKHLDAACEARAGGGLNRNLVAARDLERYYALIEAAGQRVGLTNEEWNYVRSALAGYQPGPIVNVWALWAEVLDEEALCLAETEGLCIDTAALAEKLRGLSLLENVAILDAVERFWAEVET